jgi:ATP-dependent DNA helicase RecG
MMKENENVEFKREVTDELKKEIVSLANYYGGTIYIGIEDDGKVIGVSDDKAD